MGRAEVTASLDATLLVVGQGALVDGLARRLSSESIELVRGTREEIAELARVSAPDLILLAGDSAADGGSLVLETLAASGAGGQLVVVIVGASSLALGVVGLRSNVATLVPEGGLDLCAQRVRRLIERLAGRGLGKQTLQQIVDEITRGPAAEPKSAVTLKQPSTAAAAVHTAAPQRTRSPTLVGLPPLARAAAILPDPPAAAGAKATRLAAPPSAAASKSPVSAFARTIVAGLPEPPAVASPAAPAAAIAVATESAPEQEEVVVLLAEQGHPPSVPAEPELVEFVPSEAPVLPAPDRAEIYVPGRSRTGRALLQPALAIYTRMRALAGRAAERASLRKLSVSNMLLRSRAARGEMMAWTPIWRAWFTRQRMLAAAVLLFIGAMGMLAVVARGGRTEPSAVAASLAAVAHASSHEGRSEASLPRSAATTHAVPPSDTRAKTQHRAGSDSKRDIRAARAAAHTDTRASDEVDAEVDNTSGKEQGRGSKALRPELQRKLERANRFVDEGHGLLKRAHLGLAEAAYLKALAAWPDLPRALAGLTRVHLQRRDGSEAVRWAKRLVAKEPKSGQNQLLLGDAWALRGDAKSARAAWIQAVRYANSTARKRLKEPPTRAHQASRP